MTDREKALIDLHKQFLYLGYKISEYEMAKVTPPEYLLKKFKEVERQMRVVSKALE
jgi:hypothetical protein